MTTHDSQGYWGSFLFSAAVADDSMTIRYKSRLLVLITLITGLLMWTYSFISIFFVQGRTLGMIGVICSTIHLLSPVVYRLSRSMTVAAYNMVVAGMAFQFSFSFFTGGFYAPTLIWFAVLPLIVGLLTNRAHAALWTLISATAYVGMFFLQEAGWVPESTLSELGRTLTQFMIGLGLIGLVGGFTLFFLELSYFYYHKPKGS
ncbi:MAG: hypothetical protein OM95_00745 [Bdellovibrio sp. ArHS]|uniref:hypothetical protein n=1 Tax=Bdellovibrio sp. ArHS TaxID=1569284 RepID=UPI000583F1F1|nr:hypothetical protein [Bdellovibrio sp. ArHS]KHD89933.1 MAG: hypothetical protein OM95_00745 [Bdellovibrio sp. ArHS]